MKDRIEVTTTIGGQNRDVVVFTQYIVSITQRGTFCDIELSTGTKIETNQSLTQVIGKLDN